MSAERAPLRTLDDLERSLDGQKVFVRVDFNVPMAGDSITDDTRIRAALPTIRELLERGAIPVLASHRGRPKGHRDPSLGLAPVARALQERLGGEVLFADDCIGAPRRDAVDAASSGQVVLLENLRFHPGEKEDDPEFAKGLVEGCHHYVDDAFGAVHRAHASVSAAARLFEDPAAGRLVESEVEALSRLLDRPEEPFVAVLGGAKIAGKIDTLSSLLSSVDTLVLGGGMANTLLQARGLDMARSLVEEDALDVAREILARADERGVELLLPTDVVVTDELDVAEPRIEECKVDALPSWGRAVDLGERSIARARDAIARARTLFWNGPMGVFERPPFDRGSRAIAEAIAECPGFTVAGGGETAAVARLAGVDDRLDHVSTGGGASLEFLAGRELPGLTVLRRTES